MKSVGEVHFLEIDSVVSSSNDTKKLFGEADEYRVTALVDALQEVEK